MLTAAEGSIAEGACGVLKELKRDAAAACRINCEMHCGDLKTSVVWGCDLSAIVRCWRLFDEMHRRE